MRLLSNSISKIGLLVALSFLPSLACADAAQYVGYGNQMLQQRQYDKAIQYYGYAVKADPHNAAAYKGLGYATVGKRDTNGGIKYLEYALTLNPNDASLRKYLGSLYAGYGNQYYARHDKTNALAWWNKAIRTDPSNTSLANYVAGLGGSGGGAQTQVSAPKSEAPASEATPGVNPWIMGGAVAVLGAVMLFIF